ncbi:MAG TPA: hypothetical protein VIC60_05825, partial [Thermomicrobiales bacterium]
TERPATPSRSRAPRPRPAIAAVAPAPANHAALLAEAVWSLDRLGMAGVEMPEPKGVYRIDDVLALDDRTDAPAEIIILGTHGGARIAQAIVVGNKRPMPDDEIMRAYLATLPGPIAAARYRIAPAFRVVAGKADTMAVLGNRRSVVLPV